MVKKLSKYYNIRTNTNNKGSHLGRCEPLLFCYSFNQLISTKLLHKSKCIHHLQYQTILRQVYTKQEPT